MPASDALQPPLSPAEREIVKSYGGWTQFLASFDLKPWESDDAAEGKRFSKPSLKVMTEDDAVFGHCP
ncbi:hypothetical protein N7492_009034 [Penicillium capsulatum]|uniref:Uncharacterized protein n=1 Tax=Penicillium capsulatum TaxID=69766 RepID=A0A9W9HUN2_9EURO|nr:hypothetical protein N7492_009034 [Penicillium capsulatum]KAJ6106433.1 hypothetical protein N7512_009950 [Penicillium capsulatum]